jgi:DNA (cytosine-5)-methyltransferase 1
LTNQHLFPYEWTLKDAIFTKDKGKVFSCFACGGGSTMGYKLAGFDVIGCNEIDPKMMACYIANHNPKYEFLEPIQTFKLRNDLPDELYKLRILDGSPPCSSFSMAGNRQKDWGKDKIFREGQKKQILDTLFFDFIDLTKKLQPEIAVAENVDGLIRGEAFNYVKKIYLEFEKAGYVVQHFLLDASKMGVPQKRKRVFFICLRKDLLHNVKTFDLFDTLPKIDLHFNEHAIKYKEIMEVNEIGEGKLYPSIKLMYDRHKDGEGFIRDSGHKAISHYKTHPERVLNTIIGAESAGAYNHIHFRQLTKRENCLAGTFPLDYNFKDQFSKYIIGMSVPPVMTAQIATRIYDQWLSKIA